MKVRIGVDGGGSSTRAVVIDGSLGVLGRGQSGSSNYFSVGMEAALANIASAVDTALAEAKLSRSDVQGFGFGLAGVVSSAEQTKLSEALHPLVGRSEIAVDEDAAAAQSGAFAGGAGAIMIAGTGANCFGINARGERARADGWGPLLGDRGSGYSIGEAALRRVVRAYDGAEKPTSLSAPVLAAFGVDSVAALVPIVYAPEFRRDRVAALVPLVLEHADAGDLTALNLLREAGRALAHTATAVLVKLELKQVAPTGGVISRPSALRVAFEETLKHSVPDSSVGAPLYDAAVGAALLLEQLQQ